MNLHEISESVSDVAGKAPSADALAIAGVLHSIAHAIHRLGNADAATPMGGLEGLGAAIIEAAEKQAAALDGVTEEISEAADRQAAALDSVAEAIKGASQ